MKCQEFLAELDRREGRLRPGWEGYRHAESCPDCAFALRLERALEGAPGWRERARMAPSTRARILARAKMQSLSPGSGGWLLEESAATAAVLLVICASIFLALPAIVKNLLPEDVRGSLALFLQPLLEAGEAVLSFLAPITGNALGMALLVLTLFVVFLAAVMSARAFTPRLQM